MSNNSSFGAFIRSRRTEKNLTQNELALLLSVSKSAVSKWERGVSYPDITIVSHLCRVLDITEEDFMRAVNQKADEPAHEDCGASGDALPAAPCLQERPSTLYSVLKWVFLGVLAGREIALYNRLRFITEKKVYKHLIKDISKAIVGLVVSIAVVFVLNNHKHIIDVMLDYIQLH